MKDITKLEVFAAYLPYHVEATDADDDFDGRRWKQTLYNVHIAEEITESRKLILRPLSALQTPMQHPVTGERIVIPAVWIAEHIVMPPENWNILFYCDDIINYLHNEDAYYARYSRQIDRLALSLHFDIYGAIEKGWAVQI